MSDGSRAMAFFNSTSAASSRPISSRNLPFCTYSPVLSRSAMTPGIKAIISSVGRWPALSSRSRSLVSFMASPSALRGSTLTTRAMWLAASPYSVRRMAWSASCRWVRMRPALTSFCSGSTPAGPIFSINSQASSYFLTASVISLRFWAAWAAATFSRTRRVISWRRMDSSMAFLAGSSTAWARAEMAVARSRATRQREVRAA